MADLDRALARIRSVADGVGRRIRGWATVLLVAALASWSILLRSRIFDSLGAALRWLPLLLVLALPGWILLRFARRVLALGPAVDRIADRVDATVDAAREDATAGIAEARAGGGIRALLRSLRELGRHGDDVRDIVADAAGTARIVTLPYLAAVGAAIAGAGVVLTVFLVAVVTLLLS
ncbi:MAG: hypothetical protein R3290_00330 [Acidimicrobiia bacterium]|nr:hypothetical protein [Acidimicrobiia bacterium]